MVDTEKQHEALAFAVNEIRNIGWLNEPSLIPYISSKTDMLFQKQNEVVDDLLGNFIPSRIIANEGLGCTYTIEHYFNDLSNCILKAGAANDRYVQNLQICYVQKLKALSENKEQKGTILSAAIYAQINGLKGMLTLRAEKSTNGTEKKHIAYLLQILKS